MRLSQNERIFHQKEVLQRIISWITQSDIKVGTILAFQVGMTGFIASRGSNIYLVLTQSNHSVTWFLLIVSLIAYTLLSSFSIIYAFSSLYPAVVSSSKSSTFFGSIARMDEKEYVKTSASMTHDSIEAELKDQIRTNAKIADTKYKKIKSSIILLFSSSLFWISILTLLPTLEPPTGTYDQKTIYSCHSAQSYPVRYKSRNRFYHMRVHVAQP